MTGHPRQKGVPVIAYLTPEPLSLACSMRVLHNGGNQVSIALQAAVTLHGAADEQTFIAQYDADNLQPNTAVFDSAAVHIPHDRRRQIARHADPQTTTLTLSFKQACPVWCPRRETLAPRAEAASVVAFNELVALAKATTVHLVFDYRWLHATVRAAVERLVKGKQRLAGYPLDKYYAKRWELKDWTVFAPPTDWTRPSQPDGTGEPPQTDGTGEPPQKRTRLSSSPPAKRTVLDAPSPTEVATSPTYTPHTHKPPPHTPPTYTPPTYKPPTYTPSTTPTPEHDFQTHAISAAVRRHLPAILRHLLPDLVPPLLPDIVPSLFALPPSFSTSFDSDASQPQPPALTPLGTTLVPHLVAHLQPQLQAMHTRALSRTKAQREQAELQFEQDVDDKGTELHCITEQGIADLDREAGYALDKLRTKAADVVVDVAEQMFDTAWMRGELALKTTLARLRALETNGLAQIVGWELARQAGGGCRCTVRVRRGRRVGKGGYRGLGTGRARAVNWTSRD